MFAVIHLDVLTTLLPALAAGAGAVYVLLPRPKMYPWWAGVLLGAAAILFTGATILRTGAVTPEIFLFYAFSAIAVISGGLLVTQSNPARAALSFTLVVLSTCGLFLLLAAPFLMAATIIIYAGAIIVTFLFVLMLAQQAGLGNADARSREPLLATITGFVLLGALVYVLQLSYEKSDTVQALDQVLARTRETRAQVADLNTADKISKAGEYLAEPLEQLKKRREETRSGPLFDPRLLALRNHIDDKISLGNGPDDIKPELEALERDLLKARHQHGWLQPHLDNKVPLSDLSGPSANESLSNLRYDEQGRPHMPADNAAYLGRSLFTDYLLPVELGGFLLLVAVVGSIAIAQRRTTSERPT